MIAEVTFALRFGSFGWFKIMQAHEYGVKPVCVHLFARLCFSLCIRLNVAAL